jgi:dihydrofolate synthase/folylpolyglutamate synthase
MTEYSNALEYLYGLEKFGIVFGLDNIRWILGTIGDPQDSLRTIHVGGTNGKGSVACMMARILKEAGYRVGRYTSPHLISFTERIAVNEKEIAEEEVAEITGFIRGRIEQKDGNHFFTFFDLTTALAFEYFRRYEVDVAVVEVGLGGRLDSTNVLEPLTSIITNVAYDHMNYLGDTITEIAREKAGIVKDRIPVVTGAQNAGLKVIEETAKSHRSPLYALNREFSFEKLDEGLMSYHGLRTSLDSVPVNLAGDHQLSNAALAIAGLESIGTSGLSVSDEAILKGLSAITWQGRLEVVHEKPTVLLDGAHNPHGTEVLVNYLRSRYGGRKTILVFGVMRDKEYGKMLDLLVPLSDTVILTRPDMERALPPQSMKALVPEPVVTEDTRTALLRAKEVAGPGDLVVITGSFFTVGEAKAIIDEIF